MFKFWKNKKSNDDKEEASTFNCTICTETMLPSSTKKFKNNKRSCVHSICTDCIGKYIKAGIEEGNSAHMRCPALFCNQLLDPLSCTRIVPPELFNQWCDMLFDSALLGFDRCYCPYRDCLALVVNECGEDVTRSECPNCKRSFCFRCKQPWHAGYGCEDHQSDLEFEVLEKRNQWMRCPVCKNCVEHVGGCFIVKCRCGTSFCYKCGRKACHYHWCKGDRSLIYIFCFCLFIQIFVFLLVCWYLYSSSGDSRYFSIFYPLLFFISCMQTLWLLSMAIVKISLIKIQPSILSILVKRN